MKVQPLVGSTTLTYHQATNTRVIHQCTQHGAQERIRAEHRKGPELSTGKDQSRAQERIRAEHRKGAELSTGKDQTEHRKGLEQSTGKD